LKQTLSFLRKNGVESVATDDKRQILIKLLQCNIRRFCSSNRQNFILLPQFPCAIYTRL